MKRTFRFYKDDQHKWFVDLPEWSGDRDDLEMVEGANVFLDHVSGQSTECQLLMTDEKMKDSELLTLLHIREKNLGGGGIYFLENYRNEPLRLKLWLCSVTEFVFKTLPQKIWFRKM